LAFWMPCIVLLKKEQGDRGSADGESGLGWTPSGGVSSVSMTNV